MICSKCNKEKSQGSVKRGEFVCATCAKAERLQTADTLTVYQCRQFGTGDPMPYGIAWGKYKVNKRFLVLLEKSPGFRGEDRVDTNYSWKGPGHNSPEEAMQNSYGHAVQSMKDKKVSLKQAEINLEVLQTLFRKEGFTPKDD